MRPNPEAMDRDILSYFAILEGNGENTLEIQYSINKTRFDNGKYNLWESFSVVISHPSWRG
jgi:hypothetical protein